jgi:positive regulator of sigma E activity
MIKKIHWILRFLITFVWLFFLMGCEYLFPVFFDNNRILLVVIWAIISFGLSFWIFFGLKKVFPDSCCHH